MAMSHKDCSVEKLQIKMQNHWLFSSWTILFMKDSAKKPAQEKKRKEDKSEHWPRSCVQTSLRSVDL